MVSRTLAARGAVHDAYIRGDVGGSDHCPVGVVITEQP
jgi:exonuclease III